MQPISYSSSKVLVEEFAVFKIKLRFLTDSLLLTQLKTAHEIGPYRFLPLHLFI